MSATNWVSRLLYLVLLSISPCLEISTLFAADSFNWPEGRKAAVSLTFDDARKSMLDVAIPLLDQYDVKATFYVLPKSIKKRLSDWQDAVISGHEIGNHSMTHPCRCITKYRNLENYTLERMANELDVSNQAIEKMLGVTPVSFAYPCGHNYVGRGKNAQSYVPIVAQKFLTGRSWLDEFDNNPSYCDFSNLMGRSFDDLDFNQVKAMIDSAKEKGYWLILAGHEVGNAGDQVVYTETLKAICEYANDPANGIWIAPVTEVASYIAANRTADLNSSFVRPGREHLGLWCIAGLISFLGSFIILTKTPPLVARLVLVTGAIGLFFLSCWSIRYGFIGYRPFTLILIIIGFLLGCLCAVITQVRPRKTQPYIEETKESN
jgi:peptidoglycan/xylan/chitin deacetylase (PgdA/CDA1 family)